MSKKAIVVCFAVLAMLMAANVAKADQVQLGDYNVTLNQTDPGLILNWSRDLNVPTAVWNLAVGQSVTVSLFDIWTTESFVNMDDKIARDISVVFNFLKPSDVSGTLDGSTVGRSLLCGIFQYGQVKWDGPLKLDFGNGAVLQIALSDAVFNPGFLGLGKCGADVFATFTLLSGSTAVPEPSTMILLVPGLFLVGALRKRFSH